MDGTGAPKCIPPLFAGSFLLITPQLHPSPQAGYRQATTAKKDREAKSADKNFGAKHKRQGNRGSDKSLYVALARMLEKKELQPAVIFTFSKKRCDDVRVVLLPPCFAVASDMSALAQPPFTSRTAQNAESLRSLDFLVADEKSAVQRFYSQAVNRLSGTDRNLPQVLRMRETLLRGIGVHHGGLLPIIKEMVEMLFSKGLVRVRGSAGCCSANGDVLLLCFVLLYCFALFHFLSPFCFCTAA